MSMVVVSVVSTNLDDGELIKKNSTLRATPEYAVDVKSVAGSIVIIAFGMAGRISKK